MSPRPAPTRHDDTALAFLDAGASLIDALLSGAPRGRLPAPLKSLDYPAPLDWLRVEDVVRVASGRHGLSRKSFWSRWPSKDDYLRDCAAHALLYRDRPTRSADEAAWQHELAEGRGDADDRVRLVATTMVEQLLADPRSYLLCHLAPLLGRHAGLAADLAGRLSADRATWIATYTRMAVASGTTLRSGWTIDRLAESVQVILDGAILRHRIRSTHLADPAWTTGVLFTETVAAFTLGVRAPV